VVSDQRSGNFQLRRQIINTPVKVMSNKTFKTDYTEIEICYDSAVMHRDFQGDNLINKAMEKFPQVRRSVIFAYTAPHYTYSVKVGKSVRRDAEKFGWSENTAKAIIWVLKNK